MIRINLLGLPKKAKRRAPVVTLEGTPMMILLVIVLVGVVAAQLWRYRGLQSEGAALDQQIQELRVEEERLAGLRARYDTNVQRKEHLERRIAIIDGLKERRTGPAPLLDILASTVTNTESLWLTGFEQAGQNVTIEGLALSMPAVANFLTQLKNSKAFSDVEMEEAYEDNTVREMKNIIFRFTAQLAPPSPAT